MQYMCHKKGRFRHELASVVLYSNMYIVCYVRVNVLTYIIQQVHISPSLHQLYNFSLSPQGSPHQCRVSQHLCDDRMTHILIFTVHSVTDIVSTASPHITTTLLKARLSGPHVLREMEELHMHMMRVKTTCTCLLPFLCLFIASVLYT